MSKNDNKIEKKIDYSKVFTKRNGIVLGIIVIIAILALTLCSVFGGSKKDKITNTLISDFSGNICQKNIKIEQ